MMSVRDFVGAIVTTLRGQRATAHEEIDATFDALEQHVESRMQRLASLIGCPSLEALPGPNGNGHTDYATLPWPQLRSEAKARGVQLRRDMRRPELVAALEELDG